MGINAFIAYGVCLGMGNTPAEALGAVLVAGVVFLIISLTPLRAWLINSIPKSLKLGIGAGIGLFLAIIGFQLMGLTANDDVVLVRLGDVSNPMLLLGAGAPAPNSNIGLETSPSRTSTTSSLAVNPIS